MTKLKGANKIQRIFVFVFVSLFFCASISAQYRLDSWTTDDGLPQNSVNQLIQTRDGYIWGVTNGGIFRFDGVRFKVFNKSNTRGLKESRFLSLAEDGGGRVWFISTNFALAKFEKGEFKSFTEDLDYAGRISSLFFFTDSNGDLTFSTDKGQFRYQKGKFFRFVIPTEKPGSKICFIDKEGGIWLTENSGNIFGENTGIRRVFGGQTKYYAFPLNPGTTAIPRFFEDSFGNIWLFFSGAYPYRIHQGKLQVYENIPSVRSFANDADGNLLIVRMDGFSRLDANENRKEQIDPDRLQTFIESERFELDSASPVIVDREGGIWIGTLSRGLLHVSPQTFKVFSKNEWKTENDNVYPILEDSQKNVWVGTWSNALIRYDEAGNFEIFETYGELDRLTTALFEDSKKRLWVATDGKFGYFDRGKFVDVDFRSTVLAMHEDENGFLLTGGRNSLVRYDGVKFEQFTTADGLADETVTAILKTRDGKFWIGTRHGLSIFSGGKFEDSEISNELKNDNIRSLYEDAGGVIWIGTYDNGLIRFKNGKLKRITKDDGLFHENAFCTLEDDNGWFWINTNNGIYRVKKQHLNDFADGTIERVESISYNKKDGLLTLEGNGEKQPAGIKRSNGELWFPTQHGVAIVDPNKISENPLPPPVHIEEIFIDKKEIEKYGESIEIQPETDNLEINYTGVSFKGSEFIKFRYRLEGLEVDWNKVGTRRTAFYNNIPPGEYTFQVIAANRDGVWNPEGAKLRIVKLPYYYQTWWFFVLSVFTVAGVLFYIFYARTSQFRKIAKAKSEYSRRLIESQEAERKRLASELHDGLGQELIIIKNRAMLAMDDREDADGIALELGRISETAASALAGVRELTNNLRPQLLDRLGLTKAINSMLKKVSGVVEFESEIDLIDDLVSKDAEIYIYRIVQESINNIIKHSKAKSARVEIKHEENSILITIKDNGIGFDTAEVKNRKVSLGLVGLHERTQYLHGKISVDSKAGEGTTVRVSIPLDEKKYAG